MNCPGINLTPLPLLLSLLSHSIAIPTWDFPCANTCPLIQLTHFVSKFKDVCKNSARCSQAWPSRVPLRDVEGLPSLLYYRNRRFFDKRSVSLVSARSGHRCLVTEACVICVGFPLTPRSRLRRRTKGFFVYPLLFQAHVRVHSLQSLPDPYFLPGP